MKTRLRKFVRVIALIADMHIGSMFSLFKPRFELKYDDSSTDKEGNFIFASKGQKLIYNYWLTWWGICENMGVDTVIANGDLLEGQNLKGGGEGLILNRIENQKEACIELLQPYVKDRQLIVFSGSKYHESQETDAHKDIAHRLKGRYAGIVKNLMVKAGKTTKVLNVCHNMGCAMNKATTISNEGLSFITAEVLTEYPHVNAVIRAHTHTYMHTDDGYCHGIIVPCWKAYDPLFKPNLFRIGQKQATIGGVLLLFDEDGRMTVEHYLMPKVPRISDTCWNI